MQAHRGRVFSVNDFVNWQRRGELVLQPRFQRRNVWDERARSYLLDTIMRGLPIPKLYIRELIEPRALRTVREVVDGQQRLQAVIDFVDDRLKILRSHNAEFGGRGFSQLTEDEQRRFLGYELSVDILRDASDADVLEIFSRLNSYTLTLNAQEKLSARYFGQFKETIYSLGREHLEFWRSNKILTDRAIVRMGEAEFTSELVVTMLDGIQHGKSKIESFYKQYEDEFPGAKRTVDEFRGTINRIAEVMQDAIRTTAFHQKAQFYSLFTLFYDALYGLPGSEKRTRIPVGAHSAVRRSLVELVSAIREPSPPAGFLPFVDASRSSTDNSPQRVTRHEFMWEALSSALA